MMDFTRSSGVLLHITSLPGDYGSGTFGKTALKFIDHLAEAGCRYWQILPLGPIDGFYSPYCSLSAFAGNPYFIDPDTLYENGLLTKQEIQSIKIESPWTSDYQTITQTRIPLLKRAFSRADQALINKVKNYLESEDAWLKDYALYCAIRDAYNGQEWYDWDNAALRAHQSKAVRQAFEDYRDDLLFYAFLQYLFAFQWQTIHHYASEKGVKIIGDMPIYVSLASADVWGNQTLFDLDSKGRPKHVAGVPPDYFSADGQLWGNPLYRWDVMKKDDYTWWMRRIDHALHMYDTVRIDHFRAFSDYWSVPADEKTARNGKWLPGPGKDFFDLLFSTYTFDEPRIIAEDLGVVDDNLTQLLQDTALPGMRVLQFGFIEDGDNQHLPHNYVKNCFAYTGTHDNNTLLGFMWELTPDKRNYAFDYINYSPEGEAWKEGGPQSASCQAFIRALWMSPASVAIAPVQDLCGFGADTKMNHPGIADGNWAFRLPDDVLDHIDWQWLAHLNAVYKRQMQLIQKHFLDKRCRR